MESKGSKKRNPLILLLFSAVLACGVIFGLFSTGPSQVKGYLSIDEKSQTLFIEKYDLLLSGTERNGCTYFFLPSYVRLSRIDQSSSEYKLYNTDGSLLEKPTGNEQEILVDTGSGRDDRVPWSIAFLKSENLCTVFLEPGETDLFSLTKDNYESVSMQMISSEGKVLVSEIPVYIKGRGNGSAGLSKKPYELKFDNKRSLCDMKASKKWVLLANASEDTKLYNKMAFDTSEKIGMEYSIESEWVDLYSGGEYLGNYLLCREPNIGKNDLNIGELEDLNEPVWNPERKFETEEMKGYLYEDPVSPQAGGYLFEILKNSYYENKKCGFKIKDRTFSIKSPNNASKEQVEYISDFVGHVDQILRDAPDEQLSVIDEDSFSKRFLMEEYFYNLDGFINSYYFYKVPYNDRLFAGPVWDYDTCIGKGGGGYVDYTRSLLDQNYLDLKDGTPCEWDYFLSQNEEYNKYLKQVFRKSIPVFRRLIEKDIDEYYEKTKASVRMDTIVWGRDWYSSPYLEQDSHIRYTKYFLAKRLKWLCERWGIDEHFSYDFSDGTMREVTFRFPDGIEAKIPVRDGDELSKEDIPDFDGDLYVGWCRNGEVSRPFSNFMPVFEDMTLELCPIQE